MCISVCHCQEANEPCIMAPALLDLSTQPRDDYLGVDGCIRYYMNGRGITLCQYYWPCAPGAKPRGIMVLTHGHGSYLPFEWLKSQGPGKYCLYEGSFVQKMNAEGYAVCGNDNRGAGRSSGLRCYCESFNEYVADLLELARSCSTLGFRSFDPNLPKFVCGTSMGGCVALTASIIEPDVFAGAICLAPMVSLEKVAKKGLNPYLRPFGNLLNWMIPQMPLFSTDSNTMYPDLQEAYNKDSNCYNDKTRVRSAHEYLKATEWLMASQRELRLPLLLFHSDSDTMTDPQGTRRLYEEAQSSDKTLVSPENMWHVLLKEPGNEQIKEQILNWLDKHTAA